MEEKLKKLGEQNFAQEPFERLKAAHGALKAKILPQIYEYGFLPAEVVGEELNS